MGYVEAAINQKHEDIEKTDNGYLPQHILDQLANRVCRKTKYLMSVDFNKGGWKEPTLIAKEIEMNPEHVDSVVMSCCRKHYSFHSNYTSPRWYSIYLTLIYILLYYQHHNDTLYRDAIFPVLFEHMGSFGTLSSQEELNKLIDGVIKFNQLLKSHMSKNTKGVVFSDSEDQRSFDEIRDNIEKVSSEKKDAEIAALKMEITALKEQLSQLQEDGNDASEKEPEAEPLNNILPHDKVRLEALLKLMEKDDLNMSIHGNKTKAATLMNKISGLPLSTCKNYCTNRDLNVITHKNEILLINSLLQSLEMSIHL